MDPKWFLCFFAAMAVLAGSIILSVMKAIGKYKRGRILTPFNLLFVGVFLSLSISLIPIYTDIVGEAPVSVLKTVMFSLHHTFQMFTIDADREFILDSINCGGVLQILYSAYLSVALVVSPILTFGFVVSFFKNVSAYFRYIIHRYSDVYIFSELNENSLALGADIKRNKKRALLVYTDVFENNEETSYEQTERAKELRAICFKKDILAINFMHHGKNAPITFFMIGEEETENASQTIKLIQAFKDRENTRLFVFSKNTESELIINNANKALEKKAAQVKEEKTPAAPADTRKCAIKIRRVNKIRSMINEMLYTNGHKLFEEAREGEDGIKTISAVIVGAGRFGTEMLKALTWYCQMDGYRIKINVFDKDTASEDRFSAAAPELLSDDYNGVHIAGEAYYDIGFHTGLETGTKSFEDEVAKIKDVTFAFVSLGSDEDNIRAAAELRVLFERMKLGYKPHIQTVVFNTDEKNALSDVANFKGQKYCIDFIGDTETAYSEAVVLNSELEKQAFAVHMGYDSSKEEDFWRYEYNYNSSVATAIHIKARIACGIPGADWSEEQLANDPETDEALKSLEHRRWNAYMRAEGYIYSGSCDKSSRNDLGKMHNNLVDYSQLDDSVKLLDRKVATKRV